MPKEQDIDLLQKIMLVQLDKGVYLVMIKYMKILLIILTILSCKHSHSQVKSIDSIDIKQMEWEVNGIWGGNETYSKIVNKINTHFDCPELVAAVGSKAKKHRDYFMELNLATNQGRMKFSTDKKIYPLKLFLVENHRFKLIYPNGTSRYFKTINEKITFRELDKNSLYFEYKDCPSGMQARAINREYGASSLEQAQEDYDLNETYWSLLNRNKVIDSKEFSDKWEDRSKRAEIGYEKYNIKKVKK
jgi:hypothetical protein